MNISGRPFLVLPIIINLHYFFIRGCAMASGVDESLDLSQYPRPLSPPSFPGEAAKDVEARRAVRAQSLGTVLTRAQFPTLFEDRQNDGILIVLKPAGVYVDDVCRVICEEERGELSSSEVPSTSTSSNTQKQRQPVTMLHRLDRDTSGCLAFALNHEANKFYSHAFRDGEAKKTYVAKISGYESQTNSALASLPSTIKTGHGRSKHGLWRVYCKTDVGKNLPTSGTKGNRVKLAETEVLNVTNNRFAFIQLKTGRTHQIRLHMAHVGVPLVGDVKYGYTGGEELLGDDADHESSEKIPSGFRLHAARLRLPRRGGGVIDVVAPKPSWWEDEGEGEEKEGVGGYERELEKCDEDDDG